MEQETCSTKRLGFNVLANYARSLYLLVWGLCCGQLSLAVLGQTNLGIYSVVGSLTNLIAFVNSVFANSNARFFAYEIGKKDKESCNAWFNATLFVHTMLPILLFTIGYPIGLWALRHVLVIPQERIIHATYIFSATCFFALIGMFAIPYRAMFVTKQRVGELAIYDIIQASSTGLFLIYANRHPSDWLVPYAIFAGAVIALREIVVILRAHYLFPECHFQKRYFFSKSHIKRLIAFSGWEGYEMLIRVLTCEGLGIIINRLFDTKLNSAHLYGMTISSHVMALSISLQSVLIPEITKAYSAKKRELFQHFVLRLDKLGVLLIAVFAIPLIVELPYVMKLWLKAPPAHISLFCTFTLTYAMVWAATQGEKTAINATGKLAKFNIIVCTTSILFFPIAYFVGYKFGSLKGLLLTIILMNCNLSLGRVIFASILASLPIYRYFRYVFLPLLLVIAITTAFAYYIHTLFPPSFFRLFLVSSLSTLLFLPLSWLLILQKDERSYILSFFHRISSRKNLREQK